MTGTGQAGIAGMARAAIAAGTFVMSLALALGPARAQGQTQDKTYLMKISTPTINAAPDRFARNYAAALEKDSGGRIKAEVYPASQLGSIPRQIEGTQFGAIQCEVAPPEFMVGLDERFGVLAAPALVNSMQQGQRVAADPQVVKLMLGLGADKGLRGVGLFMAERSEIIAKDSDPPSRRFQGQEDSDFRFGLPVGRAGAAGRHTGGDVARRRFAGAPARRHRRRRRGRASLHRHAFL